MSGPEYEEEGKEKPDEFLENYAARTAEEDEEYQERLEEIAKSLEPDLDQKHMETKPLDIHNKTGSVSFYGDEIEERNERVYRQAVGKTAKKAEAS